MMKKIFLLILLGVVFCPAAYSAEPPTFLAEEVVITGSGREETLEKSLSSVTVLKPEKLKEQGIKNVQEALAALAGGQINSAGFLGALATINLRGSKSEQVLVLLDGVKLNSSQNGVYDFSGISLDNLERIEIVKSPLSSLYGSDALAGVVHLISKKSAKKKGEINFLAGSFGEKKYLFNFNEKISGLLYRLNLEKTDSDGFRTNSDFHNQNISLNFGLPENFFQPNFNWAYQKAERGVPGSLIFPSITARQNDENNLFNFESSFTWPQNVSHKAQIFYKNFNQNYTDPVWFSNSQHQNKNFGLSWTKNTFLFEPHILTSGITYLKESVLSNEIGEHSRDSWAIFIQDEWAAVEKLGILFGARLDRFSIFGKALTPRVGLKYQFTPDISVKTSWSQGFRAPTFNELYWPKSFWAAGNPNLKPEHGELYDAELLWKVLAAELKFSVFSGRTFDLINWAADEQGVWKPQNLNTVDRQGFEFETQVPFNLISFVFNFTWQNVTEITSGYEVTYSPHYKMNAGVNFKNPQNSLGTNLNFRYLGWRYAENTVFSQRILPGHLSTDFSSYFKVGDATLRAGVSNIFDIQYQEVADYPACGRAFWAEAGWEF